MINNFLIKLIIIFFIFFNQLLIAEDLDISSKSIEVDKSNKIIAAQGDVKIIDSKNNIISSEKIKYDKIKQILNTFGKTEILTSEKFKIKGENIVYDNNKKIVSSNTKTEITDRDGNTISVEMFNYIVDKNMFLSSGKIKITDIKDNEYFFSEIYIDEKERKIVGSDVKSFFNERSFKNDVKNEPRFFANSAFIEKDGSTFQKGIFTTCKNREGDKCPPWSIQAKKIMHNKAKKTVYYDNAVLKIYDFPIFYFPKFFHPGPTVKRQSGFLFPTLEDNTSVGFSASVPYFLAISDDKDMTFTPKIYSKENLLVLHEYRHAFKDSFLLVDSSYTRGYKKTDKLKKSEGSRSHLFAKFNKDFSSKDFSSNLEINYQHVPNDTYFKVHDIDTALVEKDKNIVTNDIKYEFQNDNSYLGISAAMYENLTASDSDKTRFEYSVPNILYERNVFTGDNIGVVDVKSNAFVKNFKVNQTTKFWINDVNWQSNPFISLNGIQNKFKGLFKVVNYEAEGAEKYKTEGLNSEVSGAISYETKLPLSKENGAKDRINFLTPKMSFRYAPGHMRNLQKDDLKLSYSNVFSLNKNSQPDVIEKGESITAGIEISNYDLEDGKPGERNYSLSIGQVHSSKEINTIPSSSSLDQKASDLVGEAFIKISENFNLNNEFSLDHNLNDINYNDLEANLILGNTTFNLNYLEENNHVGSSNYIKSGININFNNSGQLKFNLKKNLETDSTEFYDLTYDYINDCLKAGLVFRREFYADKDVEPSDSLMFRVTLFPFGEARSPLIDR